LVQHVRSLRFRLSGSRARGRARLVIGLIVASFAPIAAGCGGGGSGDGTQAGSPAGTDGERPTLNIGVNREVANLDAAKDSASPYPRRFWSEPILVRSAEDGSFGPGLATSWGYVGEGNTTFEFTLREDAKFSDGSPVTAAAVKKWFEYYAKAKGFGTNFVTFKSIETPDELTVRLTLENPTPHVPFHLAGSTTWGFVHKVDESISLEKTPVAAGAYMLDPSQTVEGDHYTMVPNEHYYDQSRIRYSKVVVKIITEPSSMLRAIQSGQLDVAWGDVSTVQEAESAGLSIAHARGGWDGLTLMDRDGTIAKPLADARVRQALNYAMDRDAITEAMIGEYGEPTSQGIATEVLDLEHRDHYSYDPDKARELLAQAGYADGFTLKVVDQGQIGNLGDPMVQAMAKYLDDVGVKLDITTAGSYVEFLEKAATKSFPVFQHNWPLIPTSILYAQALQPEGVLNLLGWSDPKLDRLIRKSLTAPEAEGAELYAQVWERTVTEAYFIPVFTFPNLIYTTDEVGCVTMTDWFILSSAMTDYCPQ
jgi:peptide/nickel transport system substrate-binding protein